MKTLSILLVSAVMIVGLSACKRDGQQAWIDCVNNAGNEGYDNFDHCRVIPDD